MRDIRLQIPECPLEYEVPHIPATHTALVIAIHAADIDWQEKLLPWTLASLINNTDLIMQGVHLYIACEAGTQDRIQTALSLFDLPENTIIEKDNTKPFITFGGHGFAYDAVCMFDLNYWAFRGPGGKGTPEIKLPLGHVLRHNYGWGVAAYSLHPANDIQTKNRWIPTAHLRLTDPDSRKSRDRLANYFMDAANRAHFLRDANRAVYGENYEKKGKTVAGYFFNETGEPNWHLDASILHYPAADVVFEPTAGWFAEWRHLRTDALIALWLLKTGAHAYNLRDSIMIERYASIVGDPEPYLPVYPRLCNMKSSTILEFRHAIKHLMGSQLAISV